ncbi:MAG TPA: penicillin-binding protein activator [Gammaproteobacteria bacterium]|nr:penicillin-binding protein activator [Gammaproteobacteria bacterium]
MVRKIELALVALVTALVVAACTSEQAVRRPSGDAASLERRAEAEEQGGDFGAAAQLHRTLAERSSGTEKARHLLEAARLDIRIDNLAGAAAELDQAAAVADADQAMLISVLQADIAVHRNQTDAALARLAGLPKQLPPALLTEADRVRGAALFAAGRPVDAVRALVERETWLDSAPAILANQRLIWDGLAASPAAQTAKPSGDPIVDGWLALAPTAAAHPSDEELRRRLLDWRRRYADHPAATGLLAELLRGQRENQTFPSQIALLLPLGSPQRVAAVAIRDGFLAERFSDAQGRESTIRVYDTASLGAQQAYSRAQLDGADFIVGPLLAPDVEQIVPGAGAVPTLALNYATAQTEFPAGFYQFGLSTEDEVQTVAEQAIRRGARTAVALYPTSARGIRILNSFRADFEALGGRVLADAGYDPAAQEFSGPIETLLNLDRSQQRRTRLAANLGVSLAFEPRRRQDVDMIFVADLDHQTGLLLAPALRFHYAGDIPTFATSEVYVPGRGSGDSDLDGIYFPVSPWLVDTAPDSLALRRSLETYWPQRARSDVIRFYGLGVDAYRLVRALYGRAESWPLEGVSGNLVLDSSGRIHREMPLAQFRGGRPVAVETAPSPERLAGTP